MAKPVQMTKIDKFALNHT